MTAGRSIRTAAYSAGVFIAAIGLAGCGLLGGPDAPPTDTIWRVVAIGGETLPRLAGNRAPTLLLESAEGRASGFTGCNRMTGSFSIEGETIRFGPLASTRMACEEPAAHVEMGYMQSLQLITRWRRRAGGLELLDAQGSVRLRLEKTGRVDPPAPR